MHYNEHTALQVAEHLPLHPWATIVTTSPPVAMALGGHPHIKIVLVGGCLVKESLAVVGAEAVAALRGIRARTDPWPDAVAARLQKPTLTLPSA